MTPEAYKLYVSQETYNVMSKEDKIEYCSNLFWKYRELLGSLPRLLSESTSDYEKSLSELFMAVENATAGREPWDYSIAYLMVHFIDLLYNM